MLKNPINHGKNKHIKIKYCFVHNVVEEKEIDLVYCFTEDQLVDLLTKAFPRPRFEVLRTLLSVSSKSIREENVEV